MDHETTMDRLVATRLATGVDGESIVRELSQNFDYVMTALRAYVNGFVEAEHGADGNDRVETQPRSFRLAR